ncbi:response regulator [Thalassotalea sp. PP2-459]|uniref:response regulator n=1 Tax=Thalassotalea sp. PP2-459 TaxID=1742724 RepID=UPI0009428C11|nr:response regulator [Thalassotalea sp. PP2-459]OKY25576.1 hybrid sensor histidine kinase/response regulator [Thalassotalea sp. PP2-459]
MSKQVTRILLVEDDEDDYILTCDYLEQMHNHHFDIDWVDNSNEALAQLKKNNHDICLLDYQLGGLNGLSVLKQSNEEGCTVPIIMLTGQVDIELDNNALDAGAVDYLVKSDLNRARFNRAIRYALARKDIENERLERIKAETKNRSKDRFLAHLSHELRTPLTSILGYTELLLNDESNKVIQPELATILNNGKHLLGLLNNVLDLSKIAAGKFELNRSPISFDSFIADVYTLMSMSAKDKGINLEISTKSMLPVEINTDSLRLRQILINIIHNAIKFTQQGSVKIDIWLEEDPENTRLYFSVTDTGVGIPENLLSTIFKPFEQVQDIVSRNEEGTGLGLSICSEILKYMSGSISVESTLAVGSKFTFFIDPGIITTTERKKLSFKRSDYQSNTKSLSKLSGNVLIVDDINDVRRLIGYACQSFDLNVDYANNGQQAITKIVSAQDIKNPYDLVLMDIHMPVLDGKRAIAQLREMGIETPIVAITAATMRGVRKELYDLGFNDVIPKPIDKYELHQKIKQQLNPLNQKAKSNQTTTQNKIDHQNTHQRVLMIEDDADSAEITALLLSRMGNQVQIAYNIKQANEILETDIHWQYILIDMNLPDGNGLQLSSILKTKVPNAIITIVSGNDVTQQELNQHGADKALLKPVNLAMLQQHFNED